MKRNTIKSIIASISIAFAGIFAITPVTVSAYDNVQLINKYDTDVINLTPADYANNHIKDDTYADIASDIMNAIKTSNDKIQINCSSYKQFKDIVDYVNETYYGYGYTLADTYCAYGPKGATYEIYAQTSRENYDAYISKKNICNAIVDYLKLDGKTDSEKVTAISNYMASILSYDYTLSVHDSVNCLYEGKAICGSYASTFAYIADAAGLKVQTVVGTAFGGAHGWNRVAINNNWYYVDVTNYDTTGSAKYILADSNFSSYVAEYVEYSNI